jgi:hypothetical protein
MFLFYYGSTIKRKRSKCHVFCHVLNNIGSPMVEVKIKFRLGVYAFQDPPFRTSTVLNTQYTKSQTLLWCTLCKTELNFCNT